MATSSITHNFVISSAADADKIASAIDLSLSEPKPPKNSSKKSKTFSKKVIRKIYAANK